MVVAKTLSLNTRGETEIINITDKIASLLLETKLKNGIAAVFVPGSTGGLTTIEYESGVISDLKKAFERVAPRNAQYAHNARWGDGNGFSHVRASMMGPSISVPFLKGKLTLGTWQQIIFVDFDNRPRTRKLIVQFVGDK